jgi:hypothetical protein
METTDSCLAVLLVEQKKKTGWEKTFHKTNKKQQYGAIKRVGLKRRNRSKTVGRGLREKAEEGAFAHTACMCIGVFGKRCDRDPCLELVNCLEKL